MGASGSSSGGKRSLHSGGSMDSSARRDSSLNSQMNMFLRTRSDSGKKLNDESVDKPRSKVSLSPNIYTLNPILTAVKCVAKKQDILRQIKVKNLDTGEEMDL